MSLLDLKDNKPSKVKAFPAYIVNIILLIFSMRSLDFLAIENVHSIFFLTPLFYWIIHKPAIMPLWFIFLGGLAIDFAIDGLLGLHAFLFIALTMILFKIRRIILSQPALYHYIIFALIVVGFEIIRWCMVSLLTWELWSLWPSLLAIVINIVAYGLILLVLKGLHRVMSGYGR